MPDHIRRLVNKSFRHGKNESMADVLVLLKGGSELEVEHSASRVPIQFFLCCTVVLYLAVLRVSAQDLEYYVL